LLARINDLVLLFYGGALATRTRTAVGLESVLADYFAVPAQVLALQGAWLRLERQSQFLLSGTTDHNNQLGVDAVVGDRLWDVQGQVRIRLGPLNTEQFRTFLPDRTRTRQRKEFFLLVHLVRLYLGPDLDFDVQLVLEPDAVPECQMPTGAGDGPRLGWDSWLRDQRPGAPATEAVFPGVVVTRL
jgi:type VI secretion system protein ImpH